MAMSKQKGPRGAMHSAGIFADMSVDGQEIGTLVAIFDRAKNLPNRKTMGKQNPYCAARLGKEAKKTATDMRGGQTPKWDQELRFTVHESPDYLQLKVSVFNDDKKTDLIGETWVDLKNVIIQGGGQSDQWHGLQCKGKYAGDVRMELTYYDTRPKDEAVLERRKEAEARQTGARPSKQTKRRPLPADPTGTSAGRPAHADRKPLGPRQDEPHANHPPPPPQKAPVPEHPRPHSSHRYETPNDLHQQWGPPHNSHSHTNVPIPAAPRHQPYQRDPRDAFHQHQNQPPQAVPVPMPIPQEYSYPPAADYNYEHHPIDQRPVEPQDPYYRHQQGHHPGMAPTEHEYVEQGAPVPPSHVPVRYPDARVPVHDPRAPPAGEPYRRYSASPSKGEPYHDRPPRNSVGRGELPPRHPEYIHPQIHDDPEEDGPPPPPPVHRHVVRQQPPPPEQHRPRDSVPMPEPLNVSPGRTPPNTNIGDLQQGYTAYAPDCGASGFSTAENATVYSTSPAPSYHSFNERPYSRDRPPTANSELVQPPVTSYNPTAVEESQEIATYYHDRRLSNAATQPGPTPSQVMRASPGAGTVERPSSSRSSNDPKQVPARKSVSPQPPQANSDGLAGIPFSPDSFDALNPNVSQASVMQQPAAAYNSPGEAMEAARQHEVDKLRELGPIVGNDGRVIDPSDHLPADTWAPEPDRKSRKPEVVVRFKHANAKGPRPSPKDQQPPTARPQSIPSHQATPQQAPPAQATPSSSSQHSGRNRLQKRPQSYVQSSPAHTPSPRGVNANALRERDNFATKPPQNHPPPHMPQQASPSPGSRYSPNTMTRHYQQQQFVNAPPVPSKVPIQPGVQNYPAGPSGDMGALSEEMRRIDIGSPMSKDSVGRRGRDSFY